MPIDPKKIAEWKRLVVWLALSDATPTRKSASDAIRDLLSDREEMQWEIEQLSLQAFGMEVWADSNEEERKGQIAGALRERDDLRRQREEMLAVLRSVEWRGAHGSEGEWNVCPVCDGAQPGQANIWWTNAADNDRLIQREGMPCVGHAPGCRLDALLRGTR